MIKKFFLSLLIFLTLVSCSTTVSFTGDKSCLSKLGKDGEFIVTTDKDILNIDKINVKRVSAAINNETGVVYGCIEGDFSKTLFDSALRLSKDFEKRNNCGFKCYYYIEKKLELYSPCDNVILFSNGSVSDVYYRFTDNSVYLSSETVLEMESSESAIYVKKPQSLPDLNFSIPDFVIKSIDSLLVLIDRDKTKAYLNFISEETANSYFKVVKAALIANIIINGEKADFTALSDKVKCDGSTVTINDIKISTSELYSLFNKDN